MTADTTAPNEGTRTLHTGEHAVAQVRRYYASLASTYDRTIGDWPAAITRQGHVLDAVIRSELGDSSWRVLDCACGIGTQSIGLATRGHRVLGTDLSPEMVARAQAETAAAGVDVRYQVADMRTLDEAVTGSFDAVVCCDNSITHVLTDHDLQLVASGMRARLRPGGLVIISTRDYDRHLTRPPVTTAPTIAQDGEGERIVFQRWRWLDASHYAATTFVLTQDRTGWATQIYDAAVYRALRRDELTRLLHDTGFEHITWHLPPASGYHQPLLTAHAPTTDLQQPTR